MKVNETDLDLAANDLGPLAWVLDELRKSLDSASAALRRFVRDTGAARGSDMASVDGGQLRIARQQLHQAVGALEMVGLPAPAHMLRAMESAVQKFVERPELCIEPSASKVERAGFALTDYLAGLLQGKPVSAVALFPQYRDVQELAGADRIHPADLWTPDWRWTDPETPAASGALAYDPSVRSRLDQAVLRVVKAGDPQAARELSQLCLSLAAGQSARQPRVFWKISAGYFEAVSLALLPLDIYVKRAGSRVLLQYASLAKGETDVSDRLAQDLLFFCGQVVPARATDAPVLTSVRLAWGLARFKPVDYQTVQFGRFDPVLLAQSRKRIVSAKETWSALAGGDINKLKSVTDQFHMVGESLNKLHPQSAPLAQALNGAVDTVVKSAHAPRTELAMEVATALLYLEAAFEDLDPTDAQLASRTTRLAERLEKVRQGGQPEALEPWMEELYRRVSDRQTMGSVVGELRTTLSELEKLLDNFFRNPQDKTPLRDAPGYLSQMRGVLSVLGLEQASHAVMRMRESVEEILVTEIDEERARAAGTFDKLGNNLGALGFLIDMLNYQPALAKKLFVYDDALGELKPLMGRTSHSHAAQEAAAAVTLGNDMLSQEVMSVVTEAADSGLGELTARLDTLATHAVLADQSGIAHTAREAAAAVNARNADAASAALNTLAASVAPAVAEAPPAATAEADIEEDDLRDIFLEEAREVVQNGLAAVQALAVNRSDLSELTTLRRAFHTLKGSSRMVGLMEFGEAGWSMEQVLNTWLADQKPASDELRTLAGDTLAGFGRWVEDIAERKDDAWKASMFRGPADAMRNENRLVALVLPGRGVHDLPAVTPAADAFAQPAAVPFAAQSAGFAEEPPLFSDEPPVFADDISGSLDEVPLFLDEPALDVPASQPVVADTPVDISFDLDLDIEPSAFAPAPVEPIEIQGIDFASLAAVSGAAAAPAAEPVPQATAKPAAEPYRLPADAFSFMPPVHSAPAPLTSSALGEPDSAADEQIKVIGSLRIGIPLYNVYLNEADEWSRRLVTEVNEWALELNRPVADSTVGLAHALAGSSATVGFHVLSDIARLMEGSLQHAQQLAYGTPQHGKAFVDAAEEIRRLLHQFAAGFLKEADPRIAAALTALQDVEVPQRDDLPEPEAERLSEWSDIEPVVTVEPPAPAQPPAAAPVAAVAPVAAFVPSAPAPVTAAASVQPPVATPVQTPAQAPVQTPMPAFAALVPSTAAPQAPVVARTVVASDQGDDEDIDVADAVDVDLFPIFEEEAIELMPQLGGALRQWTARPDNRNARDEVLRALHTLKGSARLAGALRLGEMAHRMESEIEYFGSENVNAADLEPLLHRFDGMQANLDTLRATGGLPAVVAPLQPQVEPEQPVAAPLTPAAADAPAAKAPRKALAQPAASLLAPQRAAANQAVRVRSQLLDRLVNQAGEVMITRSRLEAELGQLRGSLKDLTGNLDRLRTQLRDVELQAESQMQSRLAQSKDSAANFDPLEFDRFTRVQELTRMMAESVNDVATVQRNLQRTVEATEDDLIAQARQTRELQRDLLRTRMVEFEGISDRLYRVVRLASKETGKQVKLDIAGGSIEMDRGVLDRMTPAFEHLLRNCVAHGIEEPAVRTKAGKDAAGTILITLHQEGNDVSVEFRDDGAGLNLPRIREKALQQGLVQAGQPLGDAEAANLIFMPGFSTASQVTELSGRGIGMDVVRSEVNALGGRIETTTEAGKHTNFKLVLPLTTAVTQVVMIRSASLAIGVPATVVESVRRGTPSEVQQAYETGFYTLDGEQLPFYWSGALLQASQRSNEPPARTLPVVIFKSAAQRIAVHVDEVLGNQEVVVKNLGPQLSRLPGLAGMTVLASGAVVLIYNPVALTAVYGDQARQLSVNAASPEAVAQTAQGAGAAAVSASVMAPPLVPLVLVVDDSITVRRVTQRLLVREGYRVAMAADGLQAIERLAEERPTVVLSDIEMPRMDGFDLARNIRGDAKLAGLPIIMITSRIAEKHREHAMELGVNHYLGKPYSEEELLSLVKHYCTMALTA